MEPATTIQFTVNGRPHEATAGITLPVFLADLDLPPEQVVVERNGEALTRTEAAGTEILEGDRLEIVRIVAGG